MPDPPLLHFIRTSFFERSAADVLTDDEVRHAEQTLQNDPESGPVIQGTGGARKLRVATAGRGKRGGARVIYYYQAADLTIYLLLAYAKSEADDLSPAGKALLRAVIREIAEE